MPYMNNGWITKKKDKVHENDKDYKGSVNLEGTHYYVSGWIRNDGQEDFIAVSFRDKETDEIFEDVCEVRKNKSKLEPRHPDWRGELTMFGEEYWVSGFVKKGNDGSPYMNLAFCLKEVGSTQDLLEDFGEYDENWD